MRHHARMARRLRTRDYSPEARERLGDAVTKAREAAGYKWRTEFAKAAGGINVRSIEMLENGEPGVGQTILYAVARALPNWTEDTVRHILEDPDFPIPPTDARPDLHMVRPSEDELDLRDETERKLWAITDLPEDDRWEYIYQHRARKQRRSATSFG